MDNVVLSFDVGIIHLSYCILTKTDHWNIIDWGNINLIENETINCSNCNKKALYTNIINNETKYYCTKHSKTDTSDVLVFDECFIQNKEGSCKYVTTKQCIKKSTYEYDNKCYCTAHAKQVYNSKIKNMKMIKIKKKTTKNYNYDELKYNLIQELEKKNFLFVNYVVIENQPSFKNPKMKSIACTLYDYYLIRGIIDKNITKSNIKQVKFVAPSNKLKLNKKLSLDKTLTYKETKKLAIEYCMEVIMHLPEWLAFFKNNKKKDDLADSCLQGIYFYDYIRC